VFGEGNPESSLVIIGEAPGQTEDELGRPFVGRAGELLNKILTAAEIRREDIYITNIVKCRPAGNRTPTYEEMMVCMPHIKEQIKIINPKYIVLLGASSTKAFIDPDARITRMRGTWVHKDGIAYMPTYHPAALLRNPNLKRDAWTDFQAVRDAYYEKPKGDPAAPPDAPVIKQPARSSPAGEQITLIDMGERRRV
jgi:DNA polymerase